MPRFELADMVRAGPLLQLLLIQTQYMKRELLRQMDAMDALLRENCKLNARTWGGEVGWRGKGGEVRGRVAGGIGEGRSGEQMGGMRGGGE